MANDIFYLRRSDDQRWAKYSSTDGGQLLPIFGTTEQAQAFINGKGLSADLEVAKCSGWNQVTEWLESAKSQDVTSVALNPAPHDAEHRIIPIDGLLFALDVQRPE